MFEWNSAATPTASATLWFAFAWLLCYLFCTSIMICAATTAFRMLHCRCCPVQPSISSNHIQADRQPGRQLKCEALARRVAASQVGQVAWQQPRQEPNTRIAEYPKTGRDAGPSFVISTICHLPHAICSLAACHLPPPPAALWCT